MERCSAGGSGPSRGPRHRSGVRWNLLGIHDDHPELTGNRSAVTGIRFRLIRDRFPDSRIRFRLIDERFWDSRIHFPVIDDHFRDSRIRFPVIDDHFGDCGIRSRSKPLRSDFLYGRLTAKEFLLREDGKAASTSTRSLQLEVAPSNCCGETISLNTRQAGHRMDDSSFMRPG